MEFSKPRTSARTDDRAVYPVPEVAALLGLAWPLPPGQDGAPRWRNDLDPADDVVGRVDLYVVLECSLR
jgi:hypothetical protein